MKTIGSFAVLGTALILAGCVAAPPLGPSVAAMPAQGKTLAQFQQDDGACRTYASQIVGGATPADAANQSAVNSAAVGTLLGAAAGALIGAAAGNAGVGAAIGAGSGLLVGGTAGAGAAQASSAGVQQRYDTSYLQCMAASGESIPRTYGGGPPPSPAYAYAPPYPAYGYGPYPAYAPYPAYYGGTVIVGGGWRGGRWR